MSRPCFPIVDASEWNVTAAEVAGADEKLWLEHPKSGEQWLFKPVTVKSEHVHGEDWAEKVASELGAVLGVPCARVEMAVRGESVGSLSLNLRPGGYEMHSGAVLLAAALPDYVPGRENPPGRPGHSLENIAMVLGDAKPPPGWDFPEHFSAFDTFVGVLVLDAWIANRDRHDENWSVLYPHDADQPSRLCASYDQAGCLGYNVQDREKATILADGRLESWVRKGTAWRFEHERKPVTLVELARKALGMVAPEVASHWVSSLAAVQEDAIGDILGRVPNLSGVARNFAHEVLKVNRRRLLGDRH